MRAKRLIAASFLITIGSCAQATAQTTLLPLLHCNKKPTALSPLNSEISLRLYPFAVQTRIIEKSGAPLLRTIEQQDFLASQAEALIQEINTPNKQPLANQIHLYARQSASDTIVVVREFKLLVFPRVLLLHPKFAGLVLKPRDFVASVKLRDPSSDILREFLSENSRASAKEEDTVAVNYNCKLINRHEKLQLKEAERTRFSFDKKFFKLDDSERKALDASLVVSVVRRSVGGIELVWICPLQNTGLFRESGIQWRSLMPTIEAPETYWEPIFGSHNIGLRDGDVVEILSAELFEPL